MARIKKTGRGYQVISDILNTQTHSRLDWQEANKIKERYELEEIEKEQEDKKLLFDNLDLRLKTIGKTILMTRNVSISALEDLKDGLLKLEEKFIKECKGE